MPCRQGRALARGAAIGNGILQVPGTNPRIVRTGGTGLARSIEADRYALPASMSGSALPEPQMISSMSIMKGLPGKGREEPHSQSESPVGVLKG